MKKAYILSIAALLSLFVGTLPANALTIDTSANAGVKLESHSGRGNDDSTKSGRDHEEDDNQDDNDSDEDQNDDRGTDNAKRRLLGVNDRWRNWAFNSGIAGTVTKVEGNTITVKGTNNTTYSVDADEAKIRGAGGAMTVSQIAVGDRILVQGAVDGTSVIATLIIDAKKLDPKPSADENRAGIAGTVTAKSDSTLTVMGKNGTSYTVKTSSTTKVWKGKTESSSLSNVAIGDTVVVQGTISGSTVTAARIYAVSIPEAAANGGIRGTVTKVDGDTLTILATGGTTYSVDVSDADFIDHKNQDENQDDIDVGEMVVVHGDVNGDDIEATTVAEVQAKGGFFHRFGLFFKGLFGKKDK